MCLLQQTIEHCDCPRLTISLRLQEALKRTHLHSFSACDSRRKYEKKLIYQKLIRRSFELYLIGDNCMGIMYCYRGSFINYLSQLKVTLILGIKIKD